jgi:hypothetical protein
LSNLIKNPPQPNPTRRKPPRKPVNGHANHSNFPVDRPGSPGSYLDHLRRTAGQKGQLLHYTHFDKNGGEPTFAALGINGSYAQLATFAKSHGQPKTAAFTNQHRCGAAFALQPFVHVAAFLECEGRLSGQTGLMHMQQLLMQHFLAFAESFVLRCGLRRGSGRSKLKSRWTSDRPFAATRSSSHIADFVAVGRSAASDRANGSFAVSIKAASDQATFFASVSAFCSSSIARYAHGISSPMRLTG